MKKLRTMYPAQTGPVTSSYPYGSFRNRQFLGDLTGTPLEEQWANDMYGFMANLLALNGDTANNIAESVTHSQCAQAVQGIAFNAVRRANFAWPTSTGNPSIGAAHNVYHWCPTWGGGSGTNFRVDGSLALYQTTRTSPAAWWAPLVPPPGRWRIAGFQGYAENMESTPSVAPLRAILRRRTVSSVAMETISTLQWGSGFANGFQAKPITDTHWVTAGQVYNYSVLIDGEEHSSDYGFMVSGANIRHLAVVLRFEPF